MPASPPGTITLSISRSDGSRLSATIHYDPATRDWLDPAITVTGTGDAVLTLSLVGGTAYSYLVEAGVPVSADTLVTLGVASYADVHGVGLSEYAE